MLRFILKLTIYIGGFWLICNFLGNLADEISPMNVYAKSEAQKLSILMKNRESVQAISIGNSHSGAIDFDTFGIIGQNLARAGTDVFEVKEYAFTVAPKLPALNTVFIAVSYFTFSRNNLLAEDTKNLRIDLYSILPTWSPLPGDTEFFFLGKLHKYFSVMNIVRPDHWQGVLAPKIDPASNDDIVILKTVLSNTHWGTCKHYNDNDLAIIGFEIGGKAANTHQKMSAKDPAIFSKSFQALVETIEMLQRRNIRVVLFTPPYHPSYTHRFTEIAPEMIETMHEAMKILHKDYNVEYFDASTMEEFVNHPELFYNSDHLNECGMRAFSEYLHDQMKTP